MDDTRKIRKKKRRSHPFLGFIGALIGAALGAVIWAIVGSFGYMASFVGILIALFASKGYDMLGGRKGGFKTLVLIICIILAVGAGNLGTVALEIHKEYKVQLEEYSLTPAQMPEDEFFEECIDILEDDEEFKEALMRDFGVGILFAALGAYGVIFSSSKKKKAAKKKKQLAKARKEAQEDYEE